MQHSASLRILFCLSVGFAIIFRAFVCVSPLYADAPTGRYTLGADTATDRQTGLEWQRTATTEVLTWDSAKAHCQQLGDAWRLPLMKELLTIIDVKRINPAVDITVFPKAPSTDFWSATPVPGGRADMPRAYKVDFSIGQFGTEDTSATLRVRCVRST